MTRRTLVLFVSLAALPPVRTLAADQSADRVAAHPDFNGIAWSCAALEALH